MTLYYSDSHHGFFDSDINKKIPEDAVEITPEEHATLLADQSQGRIIGANAFGRPIAREVLISANQRRISKYNRLEADLHAYIFEAHDYPIPTQITLQAIYSDPDSNENQRAACKQIFDWVKQALAYYYSIKAQIAASNNSEDIKYDFAAACNAAAPGYTLAQIISM